MYICVYMKYQATPPSPLKADAPAAPLSMALVTVAFYPACVIPLIGVVPGLPHNTCSIVYAILLFLLLILGSMFLPLSYLHLVLFILQDIRVRLSWPVPKPGT